MKRQAYHNKVVFTESFAGTIDTSGRGCIITASSSNPLLVRRMDVSRLSGDKDAVQTDVFNLPSELKLKSCVTPSLAKKVPETMLEETM